MSLRQCLRRLLQQPFFSGLAVLTLALGLCANVAIFSVVNGALLHPLSYPAPDRLITLNVSIPQFAAKFPYFPVNAASYYAWGQRTILTDAFRRAQFHADPGFHSIAVS